MRKYERSKIAVEQRRNLNERRINKDNTDIKNIMDIVQCRINPFKQSEDNNLHNITTGAKASDDISTDLARAYEVGDEAFQQFCRERLILCSSGKKDIFATISQQKLKTFDSMSSVSRSTVSEKIIQLKGDRELFARLLVIGQTRNIEVKELLKFTLGPVPANFATAEGSLVKTNKAVLFNTLQRCVKDVSYINWRGNGKVTLIVDGMVLLHRLKETINTCGHLADIILQHLTAMATKCKASRVNLVFDCYLEHSIKYFERQRALPGGGQLIKIFSPGQAFPKRLADF